MKILAKLKRQLEENQGKMQQLLDKEAEENLSEEEKAEFKEHEQTGTELQEKIERRQAHIESQRSLQESSDNGLNVDNPGSISTHDNKQDDQKLGFQDMGEFATAVFNAFNPAGPIRDERLDYVVKFANATGLSQGSGPDGGFLVPPTFSQQIWDEMQSDSDSLIQHCDIYTIIGESLTFPAVKETSRANGSRWGGVRGYWIAEAEQMTASKPKLRQMKLEPQSLAVLVYATDKLLRNAPAMQQFIVRAAADEINFQVGDAIINGNGVGKPKGILATGPTIQVAKETSQAADTILAENIDKMTARLHPKGAAGAIWLHNHDCLPQLKNLYYPVKNVAGAENVGGFSAAMYDRKDKALDGLKTIDCEYCATVGDAGDLILANLKAYAVGIKGNVRSDMSIHLKFDYNETAFRFIYEVDGQPWLESAITPYKGSSTLSTFVKLAARA